MSGFDVSILLRLVDQLTAPSRKAGASYNAMAQNIARSSAQIRASSVTASGGITAMGNAAAKANQKVTGYFSNLRRMQAQANGSRGGVSAIGGGDTFRALGAWMGLRKSLTAAEDTAKAENKFRALVDDATPEGLRDIRKKLDARMMQTGETYAELLGAAGDAAQIVGRSKIAGDIAVAASKLTNIDTAGKTVADFSENLAAVVGPNGTVSDLTKMSDMLAMQQKLGAATAGGTIEAYKNVVGSKGIYKFDQTEMLTAIGMIKNMAPALQDSQIGNMAKYGLRTLGAPTDSFRKKLAEHGLSSNSFFTDGNFDIGKTQKMFADMVKTTKGLAEFKSLFAGKNVLAGEFWSYLANMDPAKFAEYKQALSGSGGVLDDADIKRLEGLPGVLNAIRAAGWKLARTFGEAMTPAIAKFGSIFVPLVGSVTALTSKLGSEYPMLANGVAGWLGMVAALSAFGLVSKSATSAAGILFRLPYHVFAGVLTGIASGLGGAVAAIAGLGRAATAAGGALGVLRFGLIGLLRFSAIGVAIGGVITYWRELKSAFAGFSFGLSVGWQGSELQQALQWLTSFMPGLSGTIESIKSAFTGVFSGFGDGNAEMGWFSTAAAAAEKLLNPLRSISELMAKISGFGSWALEGLKGTASGAVSSFSDWSGLGVPEAVGKKMADEGNAGAPKGVTVQANGPNVTFQQAPPSVSVSVTVNAQTNADPNAIGAAAASAVGSKVRGALSDAPHSAP